VASPLRSRFRNRQKKPRSPATLRLLSTKIPHNRLQQKKKKGKNRQLHKDFETGKQKTKKTSKIAIPASNPSFLPSSRFSRGGTEENQH
jgi:hypothetical protein